MIQLNRTDATALTMSVDTQGAEALKQAFLGALAGRQVFVPVDLDASVLSARRRSTRSETAVVVVKREVREPTLSRGDNGYVWALAEEDLQSGIDSLERAQVVGAFSPAEFLLVQIPKRRKLDHIFAAFQR